MHGQTLKSWQHEHVYLGEAHGHRERRTWFVVGLTAAMMVAEITGGTLFGSMALVADGWHMSTHAAALSIAALAYWFARTHVHDSRFAFGTGKLGELAAFSSAIILAMIALMIGYQSVVRLFHPVAIDYNEALLVAIFGLAVNLLSAWLLRDDHHHDHAHVHDDDHEDAHAHHHHDHNWRAAYIHVIADATVSVLAIAGLLAARTFGWVQMDPLVGLIGTFVIASWAIGLIRASGAVLLDIVPTSKLRGRIRERLEVDGDRISDLHLWRVGPGHMAVIASVVSDRPQPPEFYKKRLSGLEGISHVTTEIHECKAHAPEAAA
jgi:cation diffusion facilitator family transporter